MCYDASIVPHRLACLLLPRKSHANTAPSQHAYKPLQGTQAPRCHRGISAHALEAWRYACEAVSCTRNARGAGRGRAPHSHNAPIQHTQHSALQIQNSATIRVRLNSITQHQQVLDAIFVERRVDRVQDQASISRRVVLAGIVDAVQGRRKGVGAVLGRGVQAERQAGKGAGPALDAVSDPVYIYSDGRAVAPCPGACIVQ